MRLAFLARWALFPQPLPTENPKLVGYSLSISWDFWTDPVRNKVLIWNKDAFACLSPSLANANKQINKITSFFFFIVEDMLSEEREVFPFSNDWQELGVVGAGPKPLSFLRNHLLPSGPSLARLAPPPRFPLCSAEAVLSLSHFLMILQSFSLVHPDLSSQAPSLFNAAKKICFFYLQMTELSIQCSHLPLH